MHDWPIRYESLEDREPYKIGRRDFQTRSYNVKQDQTRKFYYYELSLSKKYSTSRLLAYSYGLGQGYINGMASLRQLSASFLSATNENNLALANLKFDFSLMKVEAPVEFSGLGSALSRRRRIDAEDEKPHQTARRLGGLFEQLIPSTP